MVAGPVLWNRRPSEKRLELHNDGISWCTLAQGPERLGQACNVRWKRYWRVRLSLQLPNPHEPHQCSLSHVDGQVRSRTESDHIDSRNSAGWSTPEMLHTDVLLDSFDHERKCSKPCLICCRIQRSRGMTSDTQQIRSRHTESSVCFHAEDHDACETLV